MKKFIFSFFLICCISHFLKANTQIRTGEISVQHLNGSLYEATVSLYTTIYANLDSITIDWGDGTSQLIGLTKKTILNNGYYLLEFSKQHSYINGNYTISYTSSNRAGGNLVINPPNSSQIPFHIYTYFVVDNLNPNSIPKLLNQPIFVGFKNVPLTFIPSICETDGDSLSYELVSPYSSNNGHVPNYTFPNNIGIQPQSLHVEPTRGIFNWIAPQASGLYTIAYKVNEYRGTLVSSKIIDITFEIKEDSNTNPILTTQDTTFIGVFPGNIVNFHLNSSDFDSTQSVKISATGCPFLDSIYLPTLSITTYPDSTVSDFSWQTSLTHSQHAPYTILFEAEDNKLDSLGAKSYLILNIEVYFPVSSIQKKVSSEFQIFPNPTNSWLKVLHPLGINSAIIYNSIGQMIYKESLNPQNSSSILDVSSLYKGTYIIQLNGNNGYSSSLTFIKK